MPAPVRQPLTGRSSFGNSSNAIAATQSPNPTRRSSFVSKNLSIEQIAFADPDEHHAYYNNNNTTRPKSPRATATTSDRLHHKPSLNVLTVGRIRSATPRARAIQSVSSLHDRVEQDKRAYPRKSSARVSDVSMADQDINIEVGDPVDVPGGMTGTVRFVGMVRGKKGIFAGIELDKAWAPRGKNDGDVEGTKYFAPSIPGAGIFLPAHRAVKATSPSSTNGSNFPPTPTTPSYASNLDLNKSARASSQSPQTPSLPKLSRSVTGNRPNFSQTVGPGTARATSPQLRKPSSRPSLPRPESPLRKQPSTSAAPGNRFTQSLRGGRPPGITPDSKTTFSASTNTRTPGATRSPSRTTSRNAERSPDAISNTPSARIASTNGARPPRGTSQTRTPARPTASSEETTRLKRELESRDRQLKEQATSLAEMESSLAELQTLVSATQHQHRTNSSTSLSSDNDLPSDATQLRSLLREKNEKIASLTAEFDAHRADFRSTIDTLEMASTETERVYEKRVQELLAENEELGHGGNVEEIATQLKALEELVAELEEGLEDARRGEAEARSEVEFLRGEVERGRSELRREREKAAKALRGANTSVDGPSTPGSANGTGIDQRDDEIRGLKAIIHSLSSNPEASPGPNGTAPDHSSELLATRRDLETARRERSELQGLIDRKNYREEELEREISSLKLTGGRGLGLDEELGEEGDATPKRVHSDSVASNKTAIRPGSARQVPDVPDFPTGLSNRPVNGSRPSTALSTDAFEDASEGRHSTLLDRPAPLNVSRPGSRQRKETPAPGFTSPPPGFRAPEPPTQQHTISKGKGDGEDDGIGMSALTGDGPAPGRTSKAIDMTRWCALCERDGHDSVDCPFEEF